MSTEPLQHRPITGERRPTKCKQSLLSSADILGRKWHPLILYSLLEESQLGFSELKREVDGISGKMLSESLELLVSEYGLIERRSTENSRVYYSLTDQGEALEPLLVAMNTWGQEHALGSNGVNT
jgi:DNA-binding HxlR family transcriptional regulator